MHEADPIAQEFRYAERTDGVPSFKGRSVVDMVTVFKLADFTAKRFANLFGLADQICRERQYQSFTPELNRAELEQLSKELPNASEWRGSKKIDAVKAAWMKKYQLSSRAFSRALDFIKNHREFSGNIGLPKPFGALNEDALTRLLTASIRLFSDQLKQTLDDWSNESWLHDPLPDIFESTGLELSVPFVGEVNALFYLGRDGRLAEEYEAKLQRHSHYTEPASREILRAEFVHVFEKTSFAKCMCRGLRMTGHHKIAAKFEPKLKRLSARRGKPSILPQP
jgi:hypothetical protein